ncbi:MAG TPA: hypothetical protein VMH86_07430 [Rhizomicrobium sp.]|nr:hypothetical protein [Rhizomicrobium sp.]
MNEMIAAVVGAAIGALVTIAVTWWVAKQSAKEQHYVHTDSLYVSILKLYLEHPDFASAAKTDDYATAFGDDTARYGVFAALTHNFLETVYDLFYERRKNRIHPQWERIFNHHARLHLNWLLREKNACEPEYVAFVRARFARA